MLPLTYEKTLNLIPNQGNKNESSWDSNPHLQDWQKPKFDKYYADKTMRKQAISHLTDGN